MRLPVPSRDAGAVETDDNGQILPADVMNDLVVCTLQERRVDGKVRAHSPCRERGREHGGVFLADADVIRPLGELLEEAAEAEAIRHGGCHGNDAAVLLSEGDELLPQSRGIFMAALCTHAVRLGGSALSKRVAVPLARVDVQENAPLF